MAKAHLRARLSKTAKCQIKFRANDNFDFQENSRNRAKQNQLSWMTNVTPFDEDQRSFKLPEQNTQEIYFADKISTNLLKIMFRWSYYEILVRVLSTIRDGFGLILSLINFVTNGEWFQRQEIFVPIKHFWGTKSTNWREMSESCDFCVVIITTCAWLSVRWQRHSLP